MARRMLRVAVGERLDAQAGGRLRFRMDNADNADDADGVDGVCKAPCPGQQFVWLRALAVGGGVMRRRQGRAGSGKTVDRALARLLASPRPQCDAQRLDGFAEVMHQGDFAGLAGGGDTERAGVRVLLRDASKTGSNTWP